MFTVIRALTQVLRIWWTKDRIRVARTEGKLFRISENDRLVIDDKLFVVLARCDSDSECPPQVVFTLAEDESDSNDIWYLAYTMQSDYVQLSHNRKNLEFRTDQVHVLQRI